MLNFLFDKLDYVLYNNFVLLEVSRLTHKCNSIYLSKTDDNSNKKCDSTNFEVLYI